MRRLKQKKHRGFGLKVILPVLISLVALVSVFAWASFSETVIEPQVLPEITVYKPANLGQPVFNPSWAYIYSQGDTLKLDIDVRDSLQSVDLEPSVVEEVYADLSSVGGDSKTPFTSIGEGVYQIVYSLDVDQTGSFPIKFTGDLSTGEYINFGSFTVHANPLQPTALDGPDGPLPFTLYPDISQVDDYTYVNSVFLEVPGRGKISFNSPVNLATSGIFTDSEILKQGLNLYSPNRAGINTQLIPGLDAPAQIDLYGVKLAEGVDKPGLVQMDNSGAVVAPSSENYHLINNSVQYDSAEEKVSFAVYGFSTYAINPGLQVNTEPNLLETDTLKIEGCVEDLSAQVSCYVYTEDNLVGTTAVDPVSGYFSFDLTDLKDGINSIWIKASNGAVTETWDAKPKTADPDPLQVLVNTNGLIEQGLSTEDTDIVVDKPVNPALTGWHISTVNQHKVNFYGQAPNGYWATVYYGSEPLATGKVDTDTYDAFKIPVLDLSNLPDGDLTFTMKGFNARGFESPPVNFQIHKDIVPPIEEPLILNPANDYSTADPQPVFTGTLPDDTAQDVADIRLYNGSTLISAGTVDMAAKTWSVRPALPLTPGTYNFYLILIDQSGNESSANPLPTVTILPPDS